jgi:hypothetical protein
MFFQEQLRNWEQSEMSTISTQRRPVDQARVKFHVFFL